MNKDKTKQEGLTMQYKGIKNLCTYTKFIPKGHCVQVFMDRKTKTVWGRLVGANDYIYYNDINIIEIGFIDEYMSMKQIKEFIDKNYDEYKLMCEWI